jgi:hypothetical protein
MSKENTYDPNREILEQKIIAACDGELDKNEEKKLIKELESYPDLYNDYLDMKQVPGISSAYPASLSTYRNDFHVKRIQNLITKEKQILSATFDDVIVTWFKRYAIAAIFLILGTTSLLQIYPQFMNGNADSLISELVYTYEESNADSYILYLEELWGNDD